MTKNETILTFLMDKTNWKDTESVAYCFEHALKYDLLHKVDDMLDRMIAAKAQEDIQCEACWKDNARTNEKT